MTEPAILNDMPSSPPMTEIHVWIGHYADGTESMLSAGLLMPDGTTHHMPLLNSRREVAERAGDTARKVQSASQHSTVARKIVRIELRTFRAVMS
jgi:hypothetical protein